MRYHIDVEIDYGSMGENREEKRREEWAITQKLIGEGVDPGRMAQGQRPGRLCDLGL